MIKFVFTCLLKCGDNKIKTSLNIQVVLQSSSNYAKPKLYPMTSQRNERIRLVKCRHPMVEVQEGISFVANDAMLDRESQNFLVITGIL